MIGVTGSQKVVELPENVYKDVITMVENGVFDFKNGRVIIHRDSDGTLRKIDIETTKYRI